MISTGFIGGISTSEELNYCLKAILAIQKYIITSMEFRIFGMNDVYLIFKQMIELYFEKNEF